jgi:hypothetical protein
MKEATTKLCCKFVDKMIQSRVSRELWKQASHEKYPAIGDTCPINFEPFDEYTNKPYMLSSNPNPVFFSAQSLAQYWHLSGKFVDPLCSQKVSCIDVWCISHILGDPDLLYLYRAQQTTVYTNPISLNEHIPFLLIVFCIRMGRILSLYGSPTPSLSQSLRDFEIILHNRAITHPEWFSADIMFCLADLDRLRVYIDPQDIHHDQSTAIVQSIANLLADVMT